MIGVGFAHRLNHLGGACLIRILHEMLSWRMWGTVQVFRMDRAVAFGAPPFHPYGTRQAIEHDWCGRKGWNNVLLNQAYGIQYKDGSTHHHCRHVRLSSHYCKKGSTTLVYLEVIIFTNSS
mmetsp:Transcript_9839/g.59946  ORF Transcript_9839/g.59946 Transcript_9839/m.59946 type:complete len:121 (-) Transcript_9839:490-852(-)